MEQENWIHGSKGKEKMSSMASLGMIMLWDNAGLSRLSKYLLHNDAYVLAGALIGTGIISMVSEQDLGYYSSHVRPYFENIHQYRSFRIGAIVALGIGYANTRNERITDALVSIVEGHGQPFEVVAFAAISLALVRIGSVNNKAAKAIKTAMIMQTNFSKEENPPLMRLLCLSLSLLYMGKGVKFAEVASKVPNQMKNMKKFCQVSLLYCAYAGTGNLRAVEWLLGNCNEAGAVLGSAMVAKETGVEMAIRWLEQLLVHGKKNIRKSVPVALSLLCISNPKRANVVNTLKRPSHDSDPEVAMSAILSLGLVGSGTEDAEIAPMLRELSSYYSDAADELFCVQIALVLVHLGKGLMTLNPYHSDRFLSSPVAMGGLVIFLHCCLDIRELILGDYHYVLHFLVLAMQPRMLLTVDENLKMISVPVRVGEVVDNVRQAGRSRTITGFKNSATPLLLLPSERAELSNRKYVALSSILEGVVIVKRNLDYIEDDNMEE